MIEPAAQAKFLVPAQVERLQGVRDAVAKAEPFTVAALEARVNEYLAASGLLIKDVAQPARVALTGRTASPGLFEVMEVLGRDATLARLDRGAALAAQGPAPAAQG
ncbi:MAG: hypothetical protein EOO75_02960 [Myxococcales bacterium]|nr:MAG: hypothetical protein EOO75_02960 [Myxococcales bacterium]